MKNSVSFVEFKYCYIVGQNVPVKVTHTDGRRRCVCLDGDGCDTCRNQYICPTVTASECLGE